MMRVSSLHIYPVKGCRGIDVVSAELAATGLKWDRHWMLVRPDGKFVTQRELPRMALIETRLDANKLTLRAPLAGDLSVPTKSAGAARAVRVWRDEVSAIDCGEEAARWLSEYLREPLRLVAFDASVPRFSNREFTGDVPAITEFSDGYSILILSEASLADLNARVTGPPLPMNRFRPNIVLSDCEAYAEDRSRDIAIGDARLRVVKACTRCVVTTTNQVTGEVQGNEPLRTLKTYRFDRQLMGVTFGQNAVVLAGVGAQIRVGAAVAASA
jgi:uncharacterized protein